MKKSISTKTKECCFIEKERLMDVLFACDYCTESIEERSRCYKKAAKESGLRAKACYSA